MRICHEETDFPYTMRVVSETTESFLARPSAA